MQKYILESPGPSDQLYGCHLAQLLVTKCRVDLRPIRCLIESSLYFTFFLDSLFEANIMAVGIPFSVKKP